MSSDDEMSEAVRRRRTLQDQWRRSGERPVWRNLSMIGAVGWVIVTPMLAGVLLGRWLDQQLESGIFWSGALIVAGAALGGYLAWQRINEE